ncbi:MAG: helix-hairpin-helix domain-containing protein, partial [Acidimicrobiia bacterium]|nr:helix-hairpin-helix domain-containing protein [Acidimicrobiia bacterium]NNL27654.1 helix-hairpin-helix domain-containing protein [Acidimicrobiia bacterium]
DGTGLDDGIVVVNQATATELESIPGVGAVLAKRIVSLRETSGHFTTVEDLLDVPGIGEAKLAAMREFIQVP